MTQKNRMFLILIILFSNYTSSAQSVSKDFRSAEIKESLSLAGDNSPQLAMVLNHFSKNDADSLKLKSAIFLINNMKWHETNYKSIQVDPILERVVKLADSMYYNLIKGKSLEDINSKATKEGIQKIKDVVQDSIESLFFIEPEIIKVDSMISDLSNIDADFLIEHIENAFSVRQNSPFVNKLSFDDFCEYVLPYRILDGYNFRYSGKKLKEFFSKYLGDLNDNSFSENIARYNSTVHNLRTILGNYPLYERTGFEELLFSKVERFDCFSISNYANSILNACGIPVHVEYNVAYKMLQGKHSTSTISPSVATMTAFSPESSVPAPKTTEYEQNDGWMNLFRIHFSAQKNAPYFLKNKSINEFVPENLADPRIEDVTAQKILTMRLKLPFENKTDNNLAYLETFHSTTGTIPVTWGIINKGSKEVDFKDVVPDRLYFPVYFNKSKKRSFGKAFYLKQDSVAKNGYKLIYPFKENSSKRVNLVLTRKYPLKPKMRTTADNLIGAVVLGFNSVKEKKDTLYTLDYSPQPYLQDIKLNNETAYKNYRVEAPKAFPKMNMSEIEFLTDRKFGYENIDVPSPLPVFSPTMRPTNDSSLVRVLQRDKNKLSTSPEYDGNMETAPSAYPFITFTVKNPQVITTIRFAPLNANNGIVPENEYILYYWEMGAWKALGESQVAKFNYLEFGGVPKDRLYWLNNITSGNEELPFIIDKNGKQIFFYADIK